MTEPVQIALIVAVPPTILALASLMQSRKNHKVIEDLHVIVNSRLTALLEQTRLAARAEGKVEGKAEGR